MRSRNAVMFIILILIVIAGGFAVARFIPSITAINPFTNTDTSTDSNPSTGSGLASSTQATPADSIDAYVRSMSLRDKVASLLIIHTPGTSPTTLAAYAEKYHPAGLILMEDNIPASKVALSAETRAIQANTTYPYLIAIDEEGCTVRRLASDTYACPQQLGKLPDASTTAAFAARGALLKSVGINLNFGIVADVTADTHSFIYPRVFSGEAAVAGARVALAVEASKGETLSTLKHFPGHGETPANSHLEIPVAAISKSEWAQKDAVPFQSGIVAGADLVMMGQLEYSAVDDNPATLSPAWHQILTNELNFNGGVITDDMIMLQQSGETKYSDPVKNAVAGLSAGDDILLYVNNHGLGISQVNISNLIGGIVAAVQNGTIRESTIDEKVKKVLQLRQQAKQF